MKSTKFNHNYETLWTKLWNEKNIPFDLRHKEKMLFVLKHKAYLFRKSGWVLPEWGFPKGRRNYQEKNINCALREFEEETGYPSTSLNIMQNIMPLEEVFTGSNYKSYKHCYYTAHMDSDVPTVGIQKTEVSDMKWVDFNHAIQMIREYNIEKKIYMERVNK